MAESLLTKRIKLALYHYTKAHLQGVFGAFEVVMGANTIGYGNEYVDFLTMDSDSVFRCYEIKVSREDLHSNARLSFYGDYNYLVVPDEGMVPGLLKDAMHLVSSVYGEKTGLLVYHESSFNDNKPYFTVPWKPKRQKLRIEQRIANMYNMVRSGSRYTTKWVRDQKKNVLSAKNGSDDIIDTVKKTDSSCSGISDEEFLEIFGHCKDYV